MSSSNVSWCLFMCPFVLSTCTRHSLAWSLPFIVSGRCSVYVILVEADVITMSTMFLSLLFLPEGGDSRSALPLFVVVFILDLPFLCLPNSLDVNMFIIYAHAQPSAQGLPRQPVIICENNSCVGNPFIYVTSILQKVLKKRMDWRECSTVSVPVCRPGSLFSVPAQ